MKAFLYSFFHNETNDRSERGMVSIPTDKTLWPKSWSEISYKRYLLFKPVFLPKRSGLLFQNFLTKRISEKGREKNETISFEQLSYVLRCGYGLRDESSEYRTVPSAGSRYPLEIYVCILQNTDELETGVYHYNVRQHALEVVVKKEFTDNEIRSFTSYEWLWSKSAIVCLSGVFERTVDKYGSRGYRYMLLEAGHVGQNMLLAGVEVDIHGIPVGGVNESVIEKMMGLESSEEKILYTIFF